MPTPVSNGVLLERMDQVRCEVNGLTGEVRALSENVQKFQLLYTAEHVKVVERIDAAHRRIDDHEKRIAEIDQTVQSMRLSVVDITAQVKQMKSILVGLAVMIAPLIITLIWEVITHQITLVP